MPELSAVGIDLGTTFSALAIVDEQGNAQIVPNAETERLTPSAVYFDDESIIVGQIAKDQAAVDPDRAVLYVKRQIGNPSWLFAHEGQRYSAADVSSIILAKVKRDAEQYLNRPLPHAVITVPAYFDDERRRATIAAGEQAGFKVLDLVNEPTAAAIAFGVDRGTREETVLIYDLGGGTFDVTLMRVAGKQIRIIGTDGDHQLGGKDFDDAIIQFAVDAFAREHGFDPTLDPAAAAELRAQAERAKRELSKLAKATFLVRGQGKSTRLTIGREQFERLIKPKLDTTLALVRTVLAEAKFKPADVDRVLLIGGSTRVPAVAQLLEGYFGKRPDASVNPDEAVALGAALLAALRVVEAAPAAAPAAVAEKVGGLQITDVTAHSLGVEAFVPGTSQRINSILIPRNSPIPTEVAREYVTALPGQTAIKVTIFQGEFTDPNLCNPIGEFTLAGLPAGRPPGQKVRLNVACTASGVVNVSALDIASGRQTTTEVSYRAEAAGAAKVSARDRWKAAKPIV